MRPNPGGIFSSRWGGGVSSPPPNYANYGENAEVRDSARAWRVGAGWAGGVGTTARRCAPRAAP